jgi:hypothetical protein
MFELMSYLSQYVIPSQFVKVPILTQKCEQFIFNARFSLKINGLLITAQHWDIPLITQC